MKRLATAHGVLTLALLGALTLTTGCGRNFVYQRSVSELNNKATAMIVQGDAAGAVARLESARDLMPQEPSLMYNLALAYQANNQPDKAVAMLTTFLEKFPQDRLATPAMKSLGVLQEAQADALLGKAREAKSKNDAAGQTRFTQASMSAYQQAEQTFSALEARTEGADRQAVTRHLVSLRRTMAQTASGKLSPLLTPEGSDASGQLP